MENLKKIKQFFIELISSTSPKSSKRFMGITILLSILFADISCILFNINIQEGTLSLTNTLVVVGGVLLGIGIIELLKK